MNIADAIAAIAVQLDLDINTLFAYAMEDTIGGYHANPDAAKWTVGSIWGVEGQMLYALTRAIQPEHVAEFGVNAGCSSTHFLAALAANGRGVLDSADPWEGAGQAIPANLRARWQVHYTRGMEWLTEQPDGAFDILFEDMVHGAEATRDWWRVALRKIAPGGVIISHDATHPSAGVEVRKGIAEAGVAATLYDIEPSDCGLAIWVNPERRLNPDMALTKAELAGVINGEVLEVKPNGEATLTKQPRKRTPAKKATAKK